MLQMTTSEDYKNAVYAELHFLYSGHWGYFARPEWDSQLGGSDLEIVKTVLSAIVTNRLISECISGTHPIFIHFHGIPLQVFAMPTTFCQRMTE